MRTFPIADNSSKAAYVIWPAGYGPSVFLPDDRGFAVHAVLSSRTDRQGGDSCGMVFLRERRDALQPRTGQAEHVDGCESSSKPVLQCLFKHGPK